MNSFSFGVGARLLATIAIALNMGLGLGAQGRGGPPGPPPPAKTAAPLDPTGYWVSVVTRDWRWRMMTPAKGDFPGIPANDAARKVAEGWDPAKDDAAGEQCKAYGAAGLMRLPTRLHITWQDDNTLRVDTDAGQQTRTFRFAPPSAGPSRASTKPTWQGESTARWYGGGRGSRGPQRAARIEVVTRNMRPGYLIRNGLPYSAAAVMTEYWNFMKEPDGNDYLVIATRIVDPMYLRTPYQSAPSFKREPDGAKWDPTPCSARG